MVKTEFVEGQHWAWRKSRTLAAPAARVSLQKLVQRGNSKVLRVKVRHEDGDLEGLVEFVPVNQLFSRWEEWEKIHKREIRRADYEKRLKIGKPTDSVIVDAASIVFMATGTNIDIWPEHKRICDWVTKADLDSLFDRIGWAPDSRRRYDCLWISSAEIWIPKKMAIDMAIAFAKAEPAVVELHLEAEEEALTRRHKDYRVMGWQRDELIKLLPSHAVVRQWIGRDRETVNLATRVERLERLLLTAVNELRRAGLTKPADRIDDEMRKHLGLWY